MAPKSSTLAWKIPWMEGPGRLRSMGSRRVGHDWATSLSLFTFMRWRRTWQPTPVFLPGEAQGRGAWWAAVCGVARGRTRRKRLGSAALCSPCPNPCTPVPGNASLFFESMKLGFLLLFGCFDFVSKFHVEVRSHGMYLSFSFQLV